MTDRLATILIGAGVVLAVAVAVASKQYASELSQLNLLLRPYGVIAPVVVGVLWWRRRPDSRTGPLLVLMGLLSAVPSLQLGRDPLLAALGLLAELPVVFLQAYVVITFATGRIRSREETWTTGVLLAGLLMTVLLISVPPTLRPADYLSACGTQCPPNPLYIGWFGNGDALSAGARVLVVAVLAVLVNIPVVVVFARRWQRANRRQRAALLPIGLTSLPLFAARAINQVVLLAMGLPPSAFIDLTWLSVVARVLFPMGFLIALLRAEFLASRVTSELVQRLSADRDRRSWADTIARALDDPSVRIAFWDRAAASYVMSGGRLLTAPASGSDRLWIEVSAHDGRPLAAISADAALGEEPELVHAVGAATQVAAETGELVDDVHASRARLADAADQERRRLGRDLHDSTQQRLTSIRLRLAIARDRLGDAAVPAGMPEIEAELEQALEEVRSVARGLYPALLARDGLAPALRSATRGTAVPVAIIDEGIGRWPESVESAVYFTCLEALQNVSKHAGAGASAKVKLSKENDSLVFQVADDGEGFSDDNSTAAGDGIGLRTMADRIAAIGGTLTIASQRGEGTIITGTVA